MHDRRRFLGGALGALVAGCGGGDANSETPVPAQNIDLALSQIDRLTTELMASLGVPGVAVAVVRGEEKIYSKGFGKRDLRRPDPVDADTVFQLASMSKSLGATVVAHEVGRKQVRWDQPMSELLPWFALSDPQASRLLTVGDLYSHRSGLPEHSGDHLEDMGYNQREVLERLRYMPLDGFRTKYAYTNFGLTAAGVGVAAKAQTDWATLNERVLYEPLGMSRTSSRYEDFTKRENRVVGHWKKNGQWQVNALQRMPDAQAPAASVTSSVNDLAKWLSLVLGQGAFKGRRIVDAAALGEALSPQMQTSPDRPNSHYGFGFNVGLTSGGRRLYSHSGAFELGTGTAFNVLPSAGLGIVVLTNGYPVGLPEILCAQFMDLLEHGAIQRDYVSLIGSYFVGLNAPLGSLVGVSPPASPVPSGPLSAYAGQYNNDFYGPVQVDVVGNSLQLTLGASPLRLPLQHWDGAVFTFTLETENAPPGTISKVTFADNRVTLELYDSQGLGTFVR
ncbi:serine hydrolase [Ottowia caeni]|uniref:serine hydrolase n=1 Tax=Ottowia caeni TaxID=2870339 RepID=UPI003D734599|nr:serine hydrolase [Ottowia caeni]